MSMQRLGVHGCVPANTTRVEWGRHCAIIFAACIFVASCLSSSVLYAVESEALKALDQAITVKLTARNMRDLQRVITLCEFALDNQLEETQANFARQLLTSALYERAERYSQNLLAGELDRNFPTLRALAVQDLTHALEYDSKHGEANLLFAKLAALPGGDRGAGKTAATVAVEELRNYPDRLSEALVTEAEYLDEVNAKLANYDRAIEADERNLEAWRERGRIKLAAGRSDQAIDDFLHLLATNHGDVDTLQALAQALANQEKYGEAIARLGEAIELDPQSSASYTIRARIRAVQERPEDALKDLDKALDLNSRDLNALILRAQLRSSDGKLESAMSDVERILRLRPELPEALLMRSLIHAGMGHFNNAIRDLRVVMNANPDNVQLKLQLASYLVLQHRPMEAIEVYSDIIDNAQRVPTDAYRGRGDVLLSVGKHAQAINDYEKVLSEDPKDGSVLNNLAWVLATSPVDDLRNGERAIEFAKRACDETQYHAPHMLSTLAAAYAETGDFSTAIEWSQKAVDLEDGDVKRQLSEELQSYRDGKPWREMQQAAEAPQPNDDDLNLSSESGAETA
ncbi:MAG: tetratricopeptide repeat protein, partial [Planctomycetales bacterium]|nr:tetratricopeptide repeat protein [Planctomycetales bacterium]